MTTIPASNQRDDKSGDPHAPVPAGTAPGGQTEGLDALPGEGPAGRGRVIFVGTGPGDPDLLTLMAVQTLSDADAVIMDSPDLFAILDHPAVRLKPGVHPECLACHDDGRPLTPSNRAKEVLRLANRGRRVVRLVKGDPFMDANVADEAAVCVKGGIDFEIVPGVSSLTAVPEYVGIALNKSDGIHFVSATDGTFTKAQSAQWAPTGTLVVNTRVDVVADIADAAVSSGRPASEAALAVLGGGSTAQTTVLTTLAQLAEAVQAAGLPDKTLVHVMIGPAVEQRDDLTWYESKPLFGWRVLVPRTKDQAGPLVTRLRTYGAIPEEVPTISVEPPRSPQQMDKAIRGLVEGRFEWVCFTSVNALKAVRERFEQYGLDARAFSGLKVAAVGATTANALRAWGIEPEIVPTGEQSARGLAAEFPPYDPALDPINRIFLPRADIATETLKAGLTALGWEVEDVTAYRTVRAAPPAAPVREAIKTGQFDAVVFTSSSTVRNLVGIAGKPHSCTVIAAIGPQTAKTCEEHGLRVDVIAAKPSAVDLADALAGFAADRRDAYLAKGQPVLKPSETRRGARGRKRTS
ncbi:uroporphyrinogen-III synthase [Raineyella sp. W15-4]|uniref:uroporphyrinogen-III synthase n=1 Tax=Raineyella sp. W15-4 TaxID=3081651 RepID=UPI003988F7BA